MSKLIKPYLFTLIPLLILDFLWLKFFAKNFYTKHLGFLFAEKFNLIPAVIFYLLYAAALVFFVLRTTTFDSIGMVFIAGALFGLVAYGTYDLTNQTTIKNWPVIVTLVDMAWGAFVTGVVCAISAWLNRNI